MRRMLVRFVATALAVVGSWSGAAASVIHTPEGLDRFPEFVRVFSNLCIADSAASTATGLRLIVLDGSVRLSQRGRSVRIGASPREWIWVQADSNDGVPVLADGSIVMDHIELVWRDPQGLHSLRGEFETFALQAEVTDHHATHDETRHVVLVRMDEYSVVPICGHEPPLPPDTDAPTVGPPSTEGANPGGTP
jgi:hypothetical protein